MGNVGLVRALFGTSLAFHIVFATLGVGLPLMIALAEILALRRRDPLYRLMARRWAAFFSVFLGASVASGTIVAIQLQLLWPAFMRLAGQIIALPFAIEVFAFFVEAVFTAVYVYAGERILPGLRILSALLVAIGAGASALLITDVNAFMNTPVGFRLQGGRLVDVHPWRAMLSPSMPTEITHVLVTAYLAAAFALAALTAAAWLRGAPGAQADYRRRELSLTMAVAGVAAVATALTGDASGKFLAAVQPQKFAAAEGLFRTTAGAALNVGGLPDAAAAVTRGGVDIPGLLSWLATGRWTGTVRGLLSFPRAQWPPVGVTHPLFDLMVAVGGLSLVAATLYWLWYWRAVAAPAPPTPPRWLLAGLAAMGPVAMLGIEFGWLFAELARQPWTVTGVMTTAQAATSAPQAGVLFFPFIALYLALAVGAVLAVRTHMRHHPLAAALGTDSGGQEGEGGGGPGAGRIAPPGGTPVMEP